MSYDPKDPRPPLEQMRATLPSLLAGWRAKDQHALAWLVEEFDLKLRGYEERLGIKDGVDPRIKVTANGKAVLVDADAPLDKADSLRRRIAELEIELQNEIKSNNGA